MDWQGFKKNRRKRLGEKYKPNTIREVAAKFGISTSRLMDLRQGAAIKKEEAEGKTPTGSRKASPEEQGTPQPSTSNEEKETPTKTKFSVLFRTTKYSQSE